MNKARQLLERALLILQEIGEEDLMMQIDAFLAQPEPEPVGEVDYFEYNNALHVTFTDFAYKELKVGDKLYTEQPDQSAQIIEPEPVAEIIANDGKAFDVEWNVKYLDRLEAGTKLYSAPLDQLAKIAELEQQLAEAQANLDKADCEIDRLRTIHQTAHDRLLRGDSDKELLEILEGGWGDLRQGYFSRMQRAEQQLSDLQNKKAVLLSDEQIVLCYEHSGNKQTLRPQDHFAVFSFARAIERTSLKENSIKVGE